MTEDQEPVDPDLRRTVTTLLRQLGAGEPSVRDALLAHLYDELHEIAGRQMRRERPGHTLQATALVHEAFLRLVEQDHATWESRKQFLCLGATVMRRVLVDHARARGRLKRGGGVALLSLDESPAPVAVALPDLVRLDGALTRLSTEHDRPARVVELIHFAGLTIDETAETLGVSRRTALRDWRFARSWLLREMTRGETPPLHA